MSKPLFQKRHYETIAETIRNLDNSYKIGEIHMIVEPFVKLFRNDNPKFNEERFWRAIEGGK